MNPPAPMGPALPERTRKPPRGSSRMARVWRTGWKASSTVRLMEAAMRSRSRAVIIVSASCSIDRRTSRR